jgi:uncharacterized circularly permuted ATP-grasp superfamily protein
VLGNAAYSRIVGSPTLGTYVHVCGIDIIRDDTGPLVLEDNARTPSVSPCGREPPHDAARSLRPDDELRVRSVDDTVQLHRAMTEIAPRVAIRRSCCCPRHLQFRVFRHVFLAREMGVPLVEGRI